MESEEFGAVIKIKSPAFTAIPVPLNSTIWGLPAASSVMTNCPVLGPGAVGVKDTLRGGVALPGGKKNRNPPSISPEKSPVKE